MNETISPPVSQSSLITLSLGNLAIDADSLLLLRKGDVIKIPCAFPLSGALTLSGKSWAYVSIDKKEEGLEIMVRELAELP